MNERLGFVGLGLMGTPIVANLLRAGYAVTVLDLRDEAVQKAVANGATAATSPRAVAEASEIVFTSLPHPADVRSVALGEDGIIAGLAEGGVYIDLSTNEPPTIREIAAEFAARGLQMLDSPLGGRSPLAVTADLQVMTGGDPDVFERVRPVLETIGKRVVYCGGVGNGTICKLMHNDVNAIFRQSVIECMTVATKAGVPPEVLWDIIRNGVTCAGSEINKTIRTTWLAGNFDTGTGFLRNHYKDTMLAADVGHDFGVPMPLTAQAITRLSEAMDRGWANRDATVTALIQEELAGVEVRILDPSV